MSWRATWAVSMVSVVFVAMASAWAIHAAAAPKAEDGGRSRDRELRLMLDKVIDFGGWDERVTLREALDQLQKSQSAHIDADSAALKADGVDNAASERDGPEVASAEKPLRPGKYTLRELFGQITSRVPAKSGVRVVIRKGTYVLTTEAALRRELGLVGELGPLVWEAFEDEPLADALKKVADASDATVLIDPKAKDKASQKVEATLRNVPLDTAVELLADMGGLSVVKRPGAYYVTTAENAERLAKRE